MYPLPGESHALIAGRVGEMCLAGPILDHGDGEPGEHGESSFTIYGVSTNLGGYKTRPAVFFQCSLFL